MIVFTSSMVFAQGEISDFQWEYRLLVISEGNGKIVDQLEREEAGLEERDIRIFILSGFRERDYRAKESLAKELTGRLAPKAGKPTVYLIGKDGKTTLQWPMKTFSFRKLYESIDSMPMRKREMREQG